MRVLVAPIVLAAGCNLVFGLDPPAGGATDARGDDDAVLGDDDAPDPDAGPLGAWGPAHLVLATSMLTTDEQDPALSPDGTELYFAYQAMPGGDSQIYRSARVGPTWGPIALVSELSSVQSDTSPRLSLDGNTLYLTTARPGGQGGDDVWMSTRTGNAAPWSTPANFPGAINTPAEDRSATPCDDPGRYVFLSTRNGNYDLYELAPSGTITAIAIAATNASEASPFMTADCLTLYYTSFALGSFDLYVAHRTAADLPFTDPQRIDELSSSENDEIDPWVSVDQRRMLFASGDGGVYELMESLR